jgi:hypothetical protein
VAQLTWVETWNGTRLDWAESWTEGAPFELNAPPALTFVGAFGVAATFSFTVGKPLAGGAVAGAVGSGTLEQTGPMRSDAVAGATGAATLGVGAVLTGAATASAQAQATLFAAYALAGDALAGAVGLGDLSITPPVEGIAIGITRRRVGRAVARAGTRGRIGGQRA